MEKLLREKQALCLIWVLTQISSKEKHCLRGLNTMQYRGAAENLIQTRPPYKVIGSSEISLCHHIIGVSEGVSSAAAKLFSAKASR